MKFAKKVLKYVSIMIATIGILGMVCLDLIYYNDYIKILTICLIMFILGLFGSVIVNEPYTLTKYIVGMLGLIRVKYSLNHKSSKSHNEACKMYNNFNHSYQNIFYYFADRYEDMCLTDIEDAEDDNKW